MLCLARKKGDQILIGDEIVLTVIETRTDRCKIGIEAPKEMLILRAELGTRDEDREGNGRTQS